MRIGILYNRSAGMPSGRERESVSVNEGVEIADLIERVLGSRYDVVPVRATLDVGKKVKLGGFDIIFNICEGYEGDSRGESWVTAQLEMAAVPFTGSDSMTLALCQHKAKAKQVLISKGIHTPRYQMLHSTSQKLEDGFTWPLIVKPVREDASEGITQASVVKNRLELNRMVERITDTYEQPALVEEYIEGRELNVAIMGNWPCLEVLPVSEIMFDYPPDLHRIVDFDSKWVPGTGAFKGSYGVCPSELSREEFKAVADASKTAFRVLGCRDYARVDIRLRDGIPYILEVNPNPGINTDSGFCRSAGKAGMDFPEMIMRILGLAMKRSGVKETPRPERPALISAERMNAREVAPSDIEVLLEWFNDAETAKMMDDPHTRYTREGLFEAFFLREKLEFDLICSDVEGGKPVGFISIYNVDRSTGSGEISYLIGDKTRRGRGLGKELIGLLVGYAFGELDLKRLEATVLPENGYSIKLLKNAGFREVGVLHGKFFDGMGTRDEMLFEKMR
ncbi:MAG: GNAT family N-acetyltransferase [Candidatus Thermoplasmatota archaeon]|nr:GNAT family N-acetyltransferase [Candidatus Thermoplasmatota archaeon]